MLVKSSSNVYPINRQNFCGGLSNPNNLNKILFNDLSKNVTKPAKSKLSGKISALYSKFKTTKFFEKLKEYKDRCLDFFGSSKKKAKEGTAKFFEVTTKKQKVGKKYLNKRLQRYMTTLEGDVKPNDLEDILIKSGAKDVTKEQGVVFYPTEKYPTGRKKCFELDGNLYILETHNDPANFMNTQTRLYTDGAKNKRYYMNKNGGFEIDSYGSPYHHLDSGLQGRNWIQG